MNRFRSWEKLSYAARDRVMEAAEAFSRAWDSGPVLLIEELKLFVDPFAGVERRELLRMVIAEDLERRGSLTPTPLQEADYRQVFASPEDRQVIHEVFAAKNELHPQNPEPPASYTGLTLGAYRVGEKIDEGGFGAVYQAERIRDYSQKVAIKFIRPDRDSPSIVDRFQKEKESLGRLSHPHLSRITDAGVTEQGQSYFVMDFVDGEPITDYCDKHRLTLRQRLELFTTVCEAVEHAHTQALFHRDLKPNNILVTPKDHKHFPVVIDFGLAKAVKDDGGETQTPADERFSIAGTPEYMSPEQASAGRADARTDVYSLGIVLYKLLTGLSPFEWDEQAKTDPVAMARAISQQEPQELSDRLATRPQDIHAIAQCRQTTPKKLIHQLRRELQWIPLKAIRKDPQDRYQHPLDLAADIRRYLNHEPINALPPTWRYQSRKFTRRHPALVGGTATTLVTIVAGVILVLIYAWQAEVERSIQKETSNFLSVMLASSSPEITQGAALTVRDVLDNANVLIDKSPFKDPRVEAGVRQVIGNTYSGLGLYDEAEKHLTTALAIRQRDLGRNDRDTLVSQADLGSLRQHQGKDAIALELTEESALKLSRSLGETDPDALGAQYAYAAALDGVGRYKEAEEIFRKGLDWFAKHPSNGLASATGWLNALQGNLVHQRRFTEALAIAQKTLDGLQDRLGKNHPAVLDAMDACVKCLRENGQSQQAMAMQEDLLQRSQTVYGKFHVRTLWEWIQLGNLYWYEKAYEDAGKAFYIVLKLARESERYAANHPVIVNAKYFLAITFFDVKNYEAARSMLLETIPAMESSLGAMAPNTILAVNKLGYVNLQLNNPADAIKNFELVVSRGCKSPGMGTHHPNVFGAAASAARLYLQFNQPAKADALLDEFAKHCLFALDPKNFQPDDWRTASAVREIASVLVERRRFPEAESILLQSLEALKNCPFQVDNLIPSTHQRLADLYTAWGKPQKAAEHRALAADK